MTAPLLNVYYEMLTRKLSPEQGQVYYKEKVFLLCKSCFWCASILCDDASSSRPFRSCPICKNYDLEFMPVSTEETYKFDYDRRHGVSLEFFQGDKTR